MKIHNGNMCNIACFLMVSSQVKPLLNTKVKIF